MSKSQLVGSVRSPYTRRVRLLLYAHPGTEIEFKAINYLEIPADEAYLKSVSPINKIPVLLSSEGTIFESRVIASYLTKKHYWEPLSLEQENILSMIDAANDVAVNLFLMKRSGFDVDTRNWYIDRQHERVRTCLDNLEKWVVKQSETNPAHWNYVTMSLLSYVDWAVFRKMADFSKHPGLTDFVSRFKSKPGVSETAIPA